jgi:hypothetical protein
MLSLYHSVSSLWFKQSYPVLFIFISVFLFFGIFSNLFSYHKFLIIKKNTLMIKLGSSEGKSAKETNKNKKGNLKNI